MNRLVLGTLCLLSVVARDPRPQAAQPVRHVIDVAALQAGHTPTPGIATSMPMRPPSPSASHAPVIPPPLTVQLLANSASAFSFGDPFEYRILVSNVGTDEFLFPQSIAAEAVDATMTQARMVVVGLTFVDDLLGLQMVGITPLHGARDVSGSLIPLKHGDQVEIRVPAVWRLSSEPRTYVPSWTRDLHVEATLHFYPAVGPTLVIVSDNRWDVSLRR